MINTLYMAWRYVVHHRAKMIVLVAAISLVAYLPWGLRVLVAHGATELRSRADATPLLVGAPGSALELALSSLYFDAHNPSPISYDELERITETGLAGAIPLNTRFRARRHAVVGTSLEYFEFRDLQLSSGRMMALLGECVLGAAAAERMDLSPGSTLVSSPESVFDLAGVYPLKMHVVGVLAPSFTPDDHAVFVDVRTSWIMQGLGHGHQDVTSPSAAEDVLSRDGNVVRAKASVVGFNEITDANIDSFHFHGDLGAFPLTAVIAVPEDEKARTLLLGRYVTDQARAQIVRPIEVIEYLLRTVFAVEQFVMAAAATLAVATIAIAALVFLLSIQARRAEMNALEKIGGSRHIVGSLLASEVVFVTTTATLVATGLVIATARFGPALIRSLLAS
jgi:putative ABC transport system permease protein